MINLRLIAIKYAKHVINCDKMFLIHRESHWDESIFHSIEYELVHQLRGGFTLRSNRRTSHHTNINRAILLPIDLHALVETQTTFQDEWQLVTLQVV